VTDRHIVAMAGGGSSYDDPVLDRYVLVPALVAGGDLPSSSA